MQIEHTKYDGPFIDVRVADIERATAVSGLSRANVHRLLAEMADAQGAYQVRPRRGYIRIWASDVVDYLERFARLFALQAGVAEIHQDADEEPDAWIYADNVRSLELFHERLFSPSPARH